VGTYYLKLKQKIKAILAGKIHEDALSKFVEENLTHLNSLVERQEDEHYESQFQSMTSSILFYFHFGYFVEEQIDFYDIEGCEDDHFFQELKQEEKEVSSILNRNANAESLEDSIASLTLVDR